jgi:hypothetical protein
MITNNALPLTDDLLFCCSVTVAIFTVVTAFPVLFISPVYRASLNPSHIIKYCLSRGTFQHTAALPLAFTILAL